MTDDERPAPGEDGPVEEGPVEEGPVDDDPSGVRGPGPGPRRHPSTRGGAVYLVVLAATVVGIVLVSTVDWRVGVRVEGGALLAAAAMRLVLPEADAGMLAVRNRFFDAGLCVVMSVTLIVLAGSIPDQPPPIGGVRSAPAG